MNAPKLQLEAARYYRTRDGRKAFVASTTPSGLDFNYADYPFVGFMTGSVSRAFSVWEPNGKAPSSNSDCDLIAEWVEPKRIKGWINVYAGNRPTQVNNHNLKTDAHGGHVYPSREHADIAAVTGGRRKQRIACIEIDALEGQGLVGGHS